MCYKKNIGNVFFKIYFLQYYSTAAVWIIFADCLWWFLELENDS